MWSTASLNDEKPTLRYELGLPAVHFVRKGPAAWGASWLQGAAAGLTLPTSLTLSMVVRMPSLADNAARGSVGERILWCGSAPNLTHVQPVFTVGRRGSTNMLEVTVLDKLNNVLRSYWNPAANFSGGWDTILVSNPCMVISL